MNTLSPEPQAAVPITLETEKARVRVLFNGHLLGESTHVLLLREGSREPVRYFPAGDIETSFLRRTDHTTHCPHKGQASYFTLYRDGEVIENAVWSYEEPLRGMAAISGRLAFYPEHVDLEVEPLEPAESQSVAVDDVLRHTDSGTGLGQEKPWSPAATSPDAPDPRPFRGAGPI
jgi:uncharacterized protein (DUF427 family)